VDNPVPISLINGSHGAFWLRFYSALAAVRKRSIFRKNFMFNQTSSSLIDDPYCTSAELSQFIIR
jgi:hypothetical protein